MTSHRLAIRALAVVLSLSSAAAAQSRDYQAAGRPLTAHAADPQIAAALRSVSAANIQKNIEALVAFGNRSTVSSMETDLPPHTGVTAAAAWIHTQFQSLSDACSGCLEVKDDTFTEPAEKPGPDARILRLTAITNVYAILRGTDPAQSKRIVLVTGHYDTRVNDVLDTHSPAPGANDDSSGTAVSLECARVLSRHRFPATIIFLAVAGEEQGLNGSAHFAKLAASEGWQIEAVLNNDIVGGDTTPGETHQVKSLVRVFSEPVPANATAKQVHAILFFGEENDSPSRELARATLDVAHTYLEPGPASAATLKPVLEMRVDRYLRGGDQISFNEQGYAAVRFTEWRENFNHQHQTVRIEGGVEYGDRLKFDDFSYIAKVARLNAATLATLASAPGLPQNARIVALDLENNTTLKWQAPEGAPADTAYEVVWRETAASDWQYAADAAKFKVDPGKPDVYAVKLPIAKDNVFFAVRSCSANHCSAAVSPVPEY